MMQFTMSVPATTANLGPGYDSVGMALNRYLTLQAVTQKEWEIQQYPHFLPAFAHYKEHFIYQVANQIAERHNVSLPPCKLMITSEIPLARGLGSSASAILAGIELANQLNKLNLSPEEKLAYATEIEGHPDNVAPVIFGGMVIASMTTEEQIHYFRVPVLNFDVVVYIPNIELKTEAARGVLPSHFSRRDAAAASGISNLMIAALTSGDYVFAGQMMEEDIFHEPYRAALIPNYQAIKQEARALGAYGTVISGAGPTMISFVPSGNGETTAKQMQAKLPVYDVVARKIDQQGLQVKHLRKD